MSETSLVSLFTGCLGEWKKRRRQQRHAAKCAETLDLATYWKKPEGIERNNILWTDPNEKMRGMLAADWITYFAVNAHMICPFDPKRLKPSSYELSLGPIYQLDGKIHVLTEQNPQLIIPSNSIVFVAMREALVMPHYVAARFNLSIEYIYQGLLLGTGPQVDPGFQGVLSCPLHNISNNEIKLTLGKPFAKIDFEKTTWHESFTDETRRWLASVESEEELYRHPEKLRGKDGRILTLFNSEKRWRRPIIDYPSGQTNVISSVDATERKVDDAVRKLDRITIGGFIAIVALAAALVPIVLQLYDIFTAVVTSATEQVSESERTLENVETRFASLVATQEAMVSRVATLEALTATSPRATPTASEGAAGSQAMVVPP